MLGSSVLEVALGLAVTYFVFSTLCSAVYEFIGRLLKERERGLLKGIAAFLGQSADGYALLAKEGNLLQRLLDSPQLKGLRGGSTTAKVPSEIPPSEFAAALVHVLVPGGAANATLSSLKTEVAALKDEELKSILLPLLNKTDTTLADFQTEVERRYVRVMGTMSAWYKRRAQYVLGALSVVVTLALNIDSVAIASTLYSDGAVRAVTVAHAETLAKIIPPTPAPSPAASSTSTTARPDPYAAALGQAQSLELPLGWSASTRAPFGVWGQVVGLAMTSLALLLGAPFWFDVLTRISALRAVSRALESKKG